MLFASTQQDKKKTEVKKIRQILPRWFEPNRKKKKKKRKTKWQNRRRKHLSFGFDGILRNLIWCERNRVHDCWVFNSFGMQTMCKAIHLAGDDANDAAADDENNDLNKSTFLRP